MCSSDECEDCDKGHESCKTVRLRKLTDRLNQKQDIFHKFVQKMAEVEDELLRSIQQNREKMY